MNRKVRISIGCTTLIVVMAVGLSIFWYRVVKPWARLEPEVVLIQHIVYRETEEALAFIRSQRTFSVCNSSGPFEGFHPLHIAAQYQDMECLDLLLEFGVDVDMRDGERSTPLMSAVFRTDGAGQQGVETCILKLLEHGADINAKNKHGWTALHNAANIDDARSVKFLISQGASIDQNSAAIGTPLHLSAFGGDAMAVEALLELGADVTIKNQSGQTPLDAARASHNRDNKEVIDILEKHENELLLKNPK